MESSRSQPVVTDAPIRGYSNPTEFPKNQRGRLAPQFLQNLNALIYFILGGYAANTF